MAAIETMMEEIKGMTVLELNELVKALEEEFGVSAAAAAPVMVAGGAAGAAGGEEAAEEKTEFDAPTVDQQTEDLLEQLLGNEKAIRVAARKMLDGFDGTLPRRSQAGCAQEGTRDDSMPVDPSANPKK